MRGWLGQSWHHTLCSLQVPQGFLAVEKYSTPKASALQKLHAKWLSAKKAGPAWRSRGASGRTQLGNAAKRSKQRLNASAAAPTYVAVAGRRHPSMPSSKRQAADWQRQLARVSRRRAGGRCSRWPAGAGRAGCTAGIGGVALDPSLSSQPVAKALADAWKLSVSVVLLGLTQWQADTLAEVGVPADRRAVVLVRSAFEDRYSDTGVAYNLLRKQQAAAVCRGPGALSKRCEERCRQLIAKHCAVPVAELPSIADPRALLASAV